MYSYIGPSWFRGCGCSVNGPTAVGNRPALHVEFFDRWWEKNSISPLITFGLFDALNLFWVSNKDITLFLASGSAYCLTYCLLLWNLKVFRAQCFSSNCQVGSWIYRAPLQLILDLKWNNKSYHLIIFISNDPLLYNSGLTIILRSYCIANPIQFNLLLNHSIEPKHFHQIFPRGAHLQIAFSRWDNVDLHLQRKNCNLEGNLS